MERVADYVDYDRNVEVRLHLSEQSELEGLCAESLLRLLEQGIL